METNIFYMPQTGDKKKTKHFATLEDAVKHHKALQADFEMVQLVHAPKSESGFYQWYVRHPKA